MTTQVKDLPETQSNTVATRLREARDERGLTRSEVTTATGIPVKSIEKFENGNQEPSVSRMVTLCELYEVSAAHILGQENVLVDEVTDDVEAKGMALAVIKNENADDGPEVILDELDGLRANSFDGSQRRAMALIGELVRMLRFLEPGELLQVANDRDLFEDECEGQSSLLDIILGAFNVDPMEGQKYCGLIEERIIDTAVFGTDLYAIKMAPLEVLADELGIMAPGLFFSWEDQAELVPAIRARLRELVFSEDAPQFEDQEKFPRRT